MPLHVLMSTIIIPASILAASISRAQSRLLIHRQRKVKREWIVTDGSRVEACYVFKLVGDWKEWS